MRTGNEERKVEDIKFLKAQLNQQLFMISQPNEKVMEAAWQRWDSIGKPLRSLGALERAVVKMAGMENTVNVKMDKRAIVVLCGDHGVVKEGVTQTDSSVTKIVADNIASGKASINIMAGKAGADVFPVDVGMVTDTKVRTDLKVAYGTRNMTKEPAMTREQAIQGIEAGIAMAEELKGKGYQVLATGEMGIGNTTTSSAVASVLLGKPVEDMTGRGAGLSGEGLVRKINAIKKAIALNNPDRADVIDVLAKVGGLDIAGMTGVFIGGAALGMPVVMDGFISCVSALIAVKICPQVSDYIIASHVSKEPAAHLILKELDKEAIIHAGMCLGEGTGAVALFPLMDLSCAVYNSMSTFGDINVEQYEELK